jgi:hypothetical protein
VVTGALPVFRRELFVAREAVLEASMVLDDLHGVRRFLLLFLDPRN